MHVLITTTISCLTISLSKVTENVHAQMCLKIFQSPQKRKKKQAMNSFNTVGGKNVQRLELIVDGNKLWFGFL